MMIQKLLIIVIIAVTNKAMPQRWNQGQGKFFKKLKYNSSTVSPRIGRIQIVRFRTRADLL